VGKVLHVHKLFSHTQTAFQCEVVLRVADVLAFSLPVRVETVLILGGNITLKGKDLHM